MKRWLVGMGLLLAAAAWADVSRDEAVTIAQEHVTGARVLAVDSTRNNGRAAWRVKLVTASGEVRAVLVDMTNGKVR
ncbi:PepSY domain-containing protein [Chitinibacteraceae bacterium HSL-7]